MGSKGRIPPGHLRRPLPGPDPYGPGVRPPHGAYPPFDMLPPPQVMEQKLATQHVEMQRLVTENQRLASTHGTLRQELAGAQHELQILHAQIGAIKSEREQQMRGLVESIAKMEADLKSAEPVKVELQQARAEAQNLVLSRQELIAKVQQLSQDLQRAHTDVQQIPILMAQLDGLRQEYQHCKATFDYEKKLYNDHLESLQVMEKNYVTMAKEVEKLRAELLHNSNVDRRTGASFYGTPGNNENEAAGHAVGQITYEDSYGLAQGRASFPSAAATATVTATTGAGSAGAAATGTPPVVGGQSGPPGRTGFDAQRGPGYDPQRGGPGFDAQRGGPSFDSQRGGPGFDAQRGGPGFDAQRGGPSFDAQRGPGFDTQRGPGFDAQRGPGYDSQRGAPYDAQRPGYDVQRPGYEVQRGPGFDPSRGVNHDAQSRGAAGPQGHMPATNNMPYGSATPPARAGNGYEAAPRGGGGVGANPVRR